MITPGEDKNSCLVLRNLAGGSPIKALTSSFQHLLPLAVFRRLGPTSHCYPISCANADTAQAPWRTRTLCQAGAPAAVNCIRPVVRAVARVLAPVPLFSGRHTPGTVVIASVTARASCLSSRASARTGLILSGV